jgi:hypothetical protein
MGVYGQARSTVGRAINKIKQFRAVATRYDKPRYIYLGTVTAAAFLIWLRSCPSLSIAQGRCASE